MVCFGVETQSLHIQNHSKLYLPRKINVAHLPTGRCGELCGCSHLLTAVHCLQSTLTYLNSQPMAGVIHCQDKEGSLTQQKAHPRYSSRSRNETHTRSRMATQGPFIYDNDSPIPRKWGDPHFFQVEIIRWSKLLSAWECHLLSHFNFSTKAPAKGIIKMSVPH